MILRKSPLIVITLAFCGGIILGRYISVPVPAWIFMACFSFCLGLIYIKLPKLQASFLLVSIVLLGAFWISSSRFQENECQALLNQRVRGEGMVLSYPHMSENSQTVIIKAHKMLSENGTSLSELKVLLKVYTKREIQLLPGQHLSFNGVLDLADGSRNPGQFNYREYLANQEIFCLVECDVVNLNLAKGTGFRYLMAKGREKVALILDTLPIRERGLLMGLLFGDTGMIPTEEMEGYRRAGVVHLFAVSGFNVVFVLGAAWFILGLFKPGPAARLLWAVPILLGYYFLVGWTASIVRASLMAFLAILALAMGKKNDIYTSLALSFLIILLVSPGELFLAGFQLSFLTTFGIAYLAPLLEKYGIKKTLSITMAAQIFSMPLITYYFYQISLIGPFLNILAALVSGIVTVLGLMGSLFAWVIPALSYPIFLAAGFLMYYLSEIILWWGYKSWVVLNVAAPSLPAIVIIYTVLIAGPFLLRFPVYFRMLVPQIKKTGILFLALILLFSFKHGEPEMEVIFLDVGQGDSIFIKTPRGRTMLVDGGGTPGSDYPVGKMTVSPYLRSRGFGKIDILLFTHNHLDHTEGLSEIIPEFAIGTLIMPPKEAGNQMEAMILELCKTKNIAVLEAAAGQRINLDEDVLIEILNPKINDGSIGNNHSLVLKIVFGETRWLLTGDVENEALDILLADNLNTRVDLLKIPHHGSITSYNEKFYEAVNPDAVIISVGFNFFNQPHPRVIEYFQKNRIPVYTTLDNGAVITKSDGVNLTITPWLKSRHNE